MDDGLGPVAQAEAREDLRDGALHGVLADAQRPADLLIRLALGGKVQDAQLAVGQLGFLSDRTACRERGECFQDAASYGWPSDQSLADRVMALSSLLDCVDQLLRGGVLADMPGRTTNDCPIDALVVFMAGQDDQGAISSKLATEPAHALDRIGCGLVDVHQHHVDGLLTARIDCLVDRVRLAHDVDC